VRGKNNKPIEKGTRKERKDEPEITRDFFLLVSRERRGESAF
jgi:hypothetical protein